MYYANNNCKAASEQVISIIYMNTSSVCMHKYF